MKIAVASDGERRIASHVSRCQEFLVYQVDGHEATLLETRPNPLLVTAGGQPAANPAGHGHQHRHGHAHGHGHHHGANDAECHSENHAGHHGALAGVLLDCEALIARGMGSGFWQQMLNLGVRPMIVKELDAELAALALASGELVSGEPHACCGQH